MTLGTQVANVWHLGWILLTDVPNEMCHTVTQYARQLQQARVPTSLRLTLQNVKGKIVSAVSHTKAIEVWRKQGRQAHEFLIIYTWLGIPDILDVVE